MRCALLCLLSLVLLLSPAASAAEDHAVSRGEFLLLLWESAGGVPYDITAHPFTDLTEQDDLAQAAAWAYHQGLTGGVGDNLFAPHRTLTREECATLLRRCDAALGRDTFLPDGAATCNDYADISPWADDSLYWAGITGRMAWHRGRLDPQGPVSAAEAAGYFSR